MPGPFVTGQKGPQAIQWLNQLWDRVTEQLSATSTTSLTLASAGTVTLTVQPDKQFAMGQTVRITRTADVAAWMQGAVVSYNASTGALQVALAEKNGTGTYAAWTVALTGAIGPAGSGGWSPVLAVVTDGARRVLQVQSWVGGQGSPPAAGSYLGPAGLVATAAEAVDIRGPMGDITPALQALYDAAEDAAAAAAASATAAAASATAADASADAAATSATAASGSASSAAGSATTATGAASAASASATAADASADAAATSEAVAAAAASAASASATAADASADAAAADASAAAASAAASRRLALYMTFDAATADADPGAGSWRLSHADPALATQLYIDLAVVGGGDITAWIDTWDDSTNPVKGELTLVDAADATVWLKLHVTGVTAAAGYRKVAVAHIAHQGALVGGHEYSVQFAGYGNKGNDGLGTVASVGASAPLTLGGTATDPVLGIDPATTGAAGSMSAADKTKLNGIASGATANDTDANLRARSSHTGTQAASTISDFTAAAKAATVADAINDGTTDVAPSQNAVFDALALKVPLSYLDTDTSLTANSDTKLATQKAIKTYIDALLEAQDVLRFKGGIDCSANPNYPAANTGWFYKISVAGKIGGASGVNVESGDTMYCVVDGSASGNQATVGANWVIVQANLDGAVIGPGTVTDGHVALFDGTTGKLLKSAGFAPQPLDTELTALAGLTSADDKLPYFNGAGTATLADFTSVARTLVAQTTQALMRTTGLGATTVGENLFTLSNPGAIRYLRLNADNTVTALTAIQLAADLQGDGLTSEQAGFRNIPQNSKSAAYTLVAADAGRHILHPSADTTARTFTIPANSSVAYPIGTALTFVNQNGAGTVTIAITTDTMRLAGAGTTGSRTLAANGIATAIKLTSTEWIISGTGLT